MNTPNFTPPHSHVIDAFVAHNDACLLQTIPESQNAAFFVENLCRECGRRVDNVMSEVCGKRDCQQVARTKAMMADYRLL